MKSFKTFSKQKFSTIKSSSGSFELLGNNTFIEITYIRLSPRGIGTKRKLVPL